VIMSVEFIAQGLTSEAIVLAATDLKLSAR